MQNRSKADARRSVLLSFIVLGLLSVLIIVPYQYQSNASVKKTANSGVFQRTESHVPGLENYDIRDQKSEEVSDLLMRFRQDGGKTASAIADDREKFVRGEEQLRTSVESLKVEYSPLMRSPEVITPDVYKANVERLTEPSGVKNADNLRNFARTYNDLVGMEVDQIDQLKVIADYTNPSGSMSFVNMTQEINGVPVFAGNLSAGFTTRGEMVRVINNLAPGLDYGSLSVDFGNPASAVRAAAGHINYKLQNIDVTPNEAASTENKTVFGEGDGATTAERMYFPTEIGVARAAWRVLIWQRVNAFYVIVDAETGKMLWRKNITEDQTETATYSIYGNPNAYINAADSPAPLSPGPVDPTTGQQGTIIPRTSRTLIGNEAPNWGMNDLGWITDGSNATDGNNVEAGIDRVAPDGVDAPQPGDMPCPGAGCRTFTSTWNPPPGSPGPGDDPLTPQAQRGAVVQMFYVMNLYHDVLYNLGWTEQAFNFQDNNFARGGAGGDRVRAEGQDSSGTNNANMSTPADGGRGRMQMFLWTGPTPDYDGTADGDVIIHEISHGLSNRLHGNTAGLNNNMARGMGEGWGDWYAHTLLAEPTDPTNGVYSLGGYATFLAAAGFMSNYYHGIRRFPKAPIAFTGGPGNLPHNPLTFANLNVGNCATINSAYPRGPFGSATCDQVHNAGEIWSSALWEVRNLMVTRLGFTAGSKRAMQVVTDGMKLAPIGPTFLQERDAIIAAASALPVAPNATADVSDVREGFRRRGMGFSSSIQSASPAAVTEAFDFPNVQHIDPFSVSDSTGNNNGFPEPGENVLLSVPVTNTTGGPITNVMVNISGGTPVAYGTINDAQTVTMQIPYAVPGATACGAFQMVNVNVSSTAGAQSPVARSFRLGTPVGGPAQTFENTTLIDMPAGQPTTNSGPAAPYPSTIAVAGLTGNKIISVELNQINHTWVGDLDMLLEGPGGQKYIMMSDAFSVNNRVGTIIATLTLRDDATEVMTTGGLPPAMGTFKPFNSGANDPFDAPAPAGPYSNAAPAGTDTFASTFGMDGSTMNGDWKLWIDDDAGGDPGAMDGGWKIKFESDDYTCGAQKLLFANNTPILVPGTGTSGPAAAYPSIITTSGITGPRTIKVQLPDIDHTWVDDIDVLLESPTGQKFVIMSDAFGRTGVAPAATITISDDGADGLMPDGIVTIDVPVPPGAYKPTNYGPGDPFDAPAPAGPYQEAAPAGSATFASVYGTDGSTMNGDWKLWIDDDTGGDSGTLAGWSLSFAPLVAPPKSRADFDGDGKTDLSVYRPSDGNWYVNGSTAGFSATKFGISSDIPVPADYDGDGKADKAVFRASNTPGTPDFFILKSSTMTLQGAEWGVTGDIPLAGDYTGDGKADLVVFRPSNGTWYILDQTNGANIITPFGQNGDIPMVMDNDGDGKANQAVFRPGNNTWYIAKPTGTPAQNFNAHIFGTAGDKLVPADYDGDNKDDVAVFRPSNGTWYILNSMGGLVSYVPFGISTDIPVPGDYDGDGKDDVAVYRMGTWHIKGSTSGVSQSTFGLGTDTSVPSKYIP